MVEIAGLRPSRYQFLANCIEVLMGPKLVDERSDHDLFRTELVNLRPLAQRCRRTTRRRSADLRPHAAPKLRSGGQGRRSPGRALRSRQPAPPNAARDQEVAHLLGRVIRDVQRKGGEIAGALEHSRRCLTAAIVVRLIARICRQQRGESGHLSSAVRVLLSLAKRPLSRCSLKRPIRPSPQESTDLHGWQCSARCGGLLRRGGLAPAPGHGCDGRLCPGLCNWTGRALSRFGAGRLRCYCGL